MRGGNRMARELSVLRFLARVLLTVLICTVSICTVSIATPSARAQSFQPDSQLGTQSGTPPTDDGSGQVVIIQIDGSINPGTADLLTSTLRRAELEHAKAVIIELNTPGGLLPSMQTMVEALLAAKVPTVVYVTPQGGSAMSAGVFVTMAAHIAVMAPGTNIGAAHPIASTGQDITGHAAEKIENFAVSLARAISEQRGRNAQWAELAVRESVAITDRDAVAEHVVDFIASDRARLLEQLEGRTVTIGDRPVTLSGLARAPQVIVQPSMRQRLVIFLSDPNVVILLGLGALLGLGIELFHPGAIVPGVVGAICLILSLVAGQVVPINMGGLALLLLGAVFFGIELYVPSFGIWGVAGIVCVIVGALYFVDDDAVWSGNEFSVHRSLIGSIAAIAGLSLFTVVSLAVRALQSKVSTGQEGLIGREALVIVDFALNGSSWNGRVRVMGEIWTAQLVNGSDTAPVAGDTVIVASLGEGLKLLVRARPASARDG